MTLSVSETNKSAMLNYSFDEQIDAITDNACVENARSLRWANETIKSDFKEYEQKDAEAKAAKIAKKCFCNLL